MEPTRMYVWDGDKRPEDPEIAFVVLTTVGGYALTIPNDKLGYFLKDGDTSVLEWWDNCAPIPPKRLRPMTREEMIAWADSVESHGWVVRCNNSDWDAPCQFAYHEELALYKRRKAIRDANGWPVYGEPEPFMIEEVDE